MRIVNLIIMIILISPIFLSCGNKSSEDDLMSDKISAPYFRIIFNPDLPGCGDCHNNREEVEYTFAAKANERWEEHNFDLEDEMMTINDCLLCHGVDNGGEQGAIAPTPLRSIVHQAHMSSPRFKVPSEEGEELQGNCFTCHYIMGDSSPLLYNYSD